MLECIQSDTNGMYTSIQLISVYITRLHALSIPWNVQSYLRWGESGEDHA